jgi:hypothetical protein
VKLELFKKILCKRSTETTDLCLKSLKFFFRFQLFTQDCATGGALNGGDVTVTTLGAHFHKRMKKEEKPPHSQAE